MFVFLVAIYALALWLRLDRAEVESYVAESRDEVGAEEEQLEGSSHA